ncbi:DUF2461 domain-containing protein [Blastococcus sp. KM273129]|uniref:DUF2461 domain-containing protein n=1 Tax=Blastococcus sp. KM273129 TaxID=2570315 RepID=UPI001F25F0C0|nr:DUF2461 domain-containing protein [Blastococcus sp. KM273129]
MTFDGFPDEGLVFYEGLEADNSKAYWTAHRTAYEAHVRAPMTALVEALAQEFGTAKVFRPYRDVRFSHDKTPYKNHQGAVVNPEGRGAGAWYVQISADGLTVAGGCWRLESDQVARNRRAVAEPLQGTRLAEEVSRLRAAGWRIEGERLVRVPAGYSGRGPAHRPAQAQDVARRAPLGPGGVAAHTRGPGAGAGRVARPPLAQRLVRGQRRGHHQGAPPALTAASAPALSRPRLLHGRRPRRRRR